MEESLQYIIMRKMTEHFIKNTLDANDEDAKELIRKSISKIYEEEIKELKDRFAVFKMSSSSDNLEIKYASEEDNWIQQIKCNRIKNSDSMYVDKTPEVFINELWVFKKLEDASSNVRANACKMIFTGIFHELRHYMQYLYMRYGEYNEKTIRIARELAIADSGLVDESFYRENHSNFFIENDAKEFANSEYNRIMFKRCAPSNSTGEKAQDKNRKLREMDEIEKRIIDDVIVEQGKTDLLHIYPILQNEYNFDGTKKKINIEQNKEQTKEEISEMEV